jgi:hypothetical protein
VKRLWAFISALIPGQGAPQLLKQLADVLGKRRNNSRRVLAGDFDEHREAGIPLTPELNPIEMPFSKLKADLRKAGERTIPRLRRRIGGFTRRLTAREAANYFKHSGYA